VADVEIVDTTLRDGNQSLWSARGVTTELVHDVAAVIDRVGFAVCEYTTSTIMAMAIKHQREDPWARMQFAHDAMPRTPLGFLTTGKRFITWNRTPDALLEIAYECLVRHGTSRFWVCDPMVATEGAAENARVAKRAGAAEVVVGLVFSISPLHTDEFYARAAAELDRCADVDGLYLKDPGGLLTPERLATLAPAVLGALTTKPLLEIHSHCNTGVSPRTLLDAADLGIAGLHCAVDPVSNGTSHPSVRRTVANLEVRGHRTRIQLDALGELEDRLAAYVKDRGLPTGQVLEYDEDYYRHQLPGGMVSTLRHQLAEIGREELLPAITDEVVRVRADFGHPIMVTPFSQFMASQAMLNVISGDRYAMLPDETLYYFLGDFGVPPGPVDQDLLDRVHEAAAARGLSAVGAGPSRAELRATFGTALSDEDLLMSAVISPDEVAAMHAAEQSRPISPTRRPNSIASILTRLREHPDISTLDIDEPGLQFHFRR
jgi:oxaloacetate decarboxylase (Na+ extruding) subunit alpha